VLRSPWTVDCCAPFSGCRLSDAGRRRLVARGRVLGEELRAAGAAAIFGPGTVIADAAINLLKQLSAQEH